MPLKNWEKARLLKLLEDESFRICQHAKKTGLPDWMRSEVTEINRIIDVLELRQRDSAEQLQFMVWANVDESLWSIIKDQK